MGLPRRVPFKRDPKTDPRVLLAMARLRLEQLAGESDAPVWAPHPENRPQIAACASAAQIIGYGGAAGGGKTDLLVGLAATQHQRSIIFRREYPQLKDIIRRAKELTEGSRTGFNGQNGMLTLEGMKTIEFGAMKNPEDWEKYKGRPHDLKAFDEATEILESQFRRASAWLRTTDVNQRCRIILTFNPPTNVQGMWVIRYFAPWLDPHHQNPAKPGELRWYATIAGKEDVECESGEPFYHENELIEPVSRTFFPARLSDNPHLMRTDYGRTLNALPEPLRSQLLHGSFEASMLPDPWQVLPTAWVEAAMARWKAREGEDHGPMTVMGLDVAHGGKDSTVISRRYSDWLARLDKYPGRETPDGMAAARLAFAALTDDAYINVDVIGYGASAHERLADSPPEGFGVAAIPVNFSCRSEHTDKSGKYRMTNVRAEAYWRLREELDPDNDATLCLPPDADLRNELCQAQYEITTVGIKIESKDDIKERLGRSPDSADAVALTTLPNGQPYAPEVSSPVQPMARLPEMVAPRPPARIPGSINGW